MTDLPLEVDAEERREVNRLIDLFIAGQNPDRVPERSEPERLAIEQNGVLPVLEDWSAFAGITRDCQLVWVERDFPYAMRPIDSARIRRFALFQASARYPSLESLGPARPASARDCEHCGGTGRVSLGVKQDTITIGGRVRNVRELEDDLVCYCGGLGWLLNDD